MTPKEQEIAIGELEERVDRLRNIYEQYFLGFEKLEPTVPRKDVDRRLALLRKEQIRNTAMRFRFQVVTQKYNTYAMHWIRICRQIEEGTYKRHIRKAQARFGDGARGADREVSRDVSIDVDMGDFEDVVMEDVLAEAHAALATPEHDEAPTVPPPPPSVRALGDRTARGAALPPGAKPRLLRKRDETEPPASPRAPAAGPPSSPQLPPPSNPRLPAASSAGFPAAQPARPALDIPGGRPSGPRIQRAAGTPDSSPRAPAAPAAPPAGAPSAGRVALPPPAVPPAQSTGRLPVAAPAPARPGAEASRAAAGGAPPPGAMRPAPPPSAARPAAPPPAARPAPSGAAATSAAGAKAAPSAPRIPPIPPTSSPKPMPGSGARPPMPNPPASDTVPPPAESRPSMRPRAPLPLPSQLSRPKKKE